MQITINNKKIKVEADWTILKAAQKAKIDIPTLCYHPDLKPSGRCGVCVVEVNGKIMTSCNNLVREGMVIKTNSPKVIKQRKTTIQLLGSNFEKEEEFRKWLKLENLPDVKELRFKPKPSKKPDNSSSAISINFENCILCGRCIQKCREVQSVNAICFSERANAIKLDTAMGFDLNNTTCVQCGQCSLVCPTGAIQENEHIDDVKKVLKDKTKHVIVQTAPSVRVALGEEFDMPVGSLVTGKMVTALQKLGFHKVFDTNLGADITIMEEANELIHRIKNKKTMPMFTSCCPAWVNFMEIFYPKYLKHLSSCKSPHQMFGAIAKSYYAQKFKINPQDIVVVSIMPCTAKKYEIQRDGMACDGCQDVDYVLTTRSLAKLLKEKKIDLKKLKNSEFDMPLGLASGGGAIFGATGGVMESAIRTAYNILTGKEIKNIEYHNVRNSSGLKKTTLKVAGKKLNLGIVHGLANARKLMEEIKSGKANYDFIEVMACPGGCIGGGGQPKPTTREIVKKRAAAIYKQDRILKYRQAHNNPQIKQLYDEFLGKPLSKKSHHLLHTKYKKHSTCKK
jgi:NADP-reducing hydrogenase subunit HndD